MKEHDLLNIIAGLCIGGSLMHIGRNYIIFTQQNKNLCIGLIIIMSFILILNNYKDKKKKRGVQL